MTDSTAPFTSEFVCNNLARRMVRGLDAVAVSNASQFTNDLLIPIAQRLSHGKMMRGALKQLLTKTTAKLRAEPNVVSLDLEMMQSSKLSSKEEYRLVFVITSAVVGSEDWVTFIATEVLASRTELSVSSTSTDFRIHRHALAKYMYRELKPTENMMGDLAEALHASALIGAAASGTETRQVAIPLKTGMLFGRARVVSNDKSPGKRSHFRFNRKKPEIVESERETLIESHRVIVEIMTYVDWNSLRPSREQLHGTITKFMHDHAEGMRRCFDVSYYEATVVQSDRSNAVEVIQNSIRDASNAARSLMQTPEWRWFEQSVGSADDR